MDISPIVYPILNATQVRSRKVCFPLSYSQNGIQVFSSLTEPEFCIEGCYVSGVSECMASGVASCS